MNILSFNNNCESNSLSNKDILSVFRNKDEKNLTIQQGMSVNEIAEIVSEKVIGIVKEQFQATKEQFQSK